MQAQQTYQQVLETSRRVNWRIDDLIGGNKHLDFAKPFLPETFARTRALSFLTPEERLALNHIRAYGYLALFELVETFIFPFINEQAETKDTDAFRKSAFKNFADEEAKHMQLFQRVRHAFSQTFGVECGVIGPAEAISGAVLSHSPLAVTILVLALEWMSQGHYVESVKDDADLDPLFKNMLKHHWMEEAQHAKLDTMLLHTMVANSTRADIDKAIGEFFEMGAFFDDGLRQQAGLDLESFEKHRGQPLSAERREQFLQVQHQAWRWTVLGCALGNKNFLAALDALGAGVRTRIETAGKAFC